MFIRRKTILNRRFKIEFTHSLISIYIGEFTGRLGIFYVANLVLSLLLGLWTLFHALIPGSLAKGSCLAARLAYFKCKYIQRHLHRLNYTNPICRQDWGISCIELSASTITSADNPSRIDWTWLNQPKLSLHKETPLWYFCFLCCQAPDSSIRRTALLGFAIPFNNVAAMCEGDNPREERKALQRRFPLSP